MNAKKAKLIRKLMRNMKGHTDKITGVHSFIENESKRKIVQVTDINGSTGGAELVTKNVEISKGTMTVNPTTERGLYLHLKSSVK